MLYTVFKKRIPYTVLHFSYKYLCKVKPNRSTKHLLQSNSMNADIKLTLAADSLSIFRRCKMNCVVDPFTTSVRNTIPPVKKTNCKDFQELTIIY